MATTLTPPSGLKLVALDIDDTLIPWHGTLAKETIDAIRTVHSAGIEVVLASGRGVYDVVPVVVELGIDDAWALCSNGSVTVQVRDGVATEAARIAFDPRGIVAALRVMDPEAPVAIETSGLGFLVDGEPFGGQAPHVVGGLAELPSEVSFLSIGSSRLSTERLLATCDDAPVHVVPYPHDGWVTLDIVSAAAGKGAALAALAAELGIDASQCAAVGDYLNDIPMLEWAGWSVAMGQAPQAVRDVADVVVASSADHGAAQALLAIAAS